jgi:bifunctional NMN adenylyltransferase/nudix hydrolase
MVLMEQEMFHYREGGDPMRKYHYAVFIGRFQPLHNGHLENLTNAMDIADKVIVLVGSAFAARNIRNPFSFAERYAMIVNSVPDVQQHRLTIKPIRDFLYNDQDWIAEVQGVVNDVIDPYDEEIKVALVGAKKDDTTFYLDMFPQWTFVQTNEVVNHAATVIRDKYFSYDIDYRYLDCPEITKIFLKDFRATEDYKRLADEHKFIKEYKDSFKAMPYPPTFVTTDAVVLCNGHVLLVKRKANPGKGLWALPGGFLAQDERLEDCTIRELKEETRIGVHKNVIRGSFITSKVFDAPNRSLRGRTITHASLFVLRQSELPSVKGSDDAEKAKWIPYVAFYDMEDKLYEDHFHIIKHFIGLAR